MESRPNPYPSRKIRMRHPELVPVTQGLRSQVSRPRQSTNQVSLPRLRPRLFPHPYARITLQQSTQTSPSPAPSMAYNEPIVCLICLENMHPQTQRHISSLKCGHVFCTNCIISWATRKLLCPYCSDKILIVDIRRIILL